MANYEPDDEWKVQLKSRIEDGLQSMVADAKENHEAELRKASDDPETRTRLEVDYKQAMQTIKSLATEQYQLELDRERNQRRWTAGVPMTPAWTQYFREEQQNIMNSIKQTSNQTDNSVRTVTESPTEEPRSATSKPSSTPPRTRLSSIDRPSQPSPVSSDRWDSSLGRSSGSIPSAEPHLARSPPKPLPEVWKPTISSTDDVLPPKTYNLGRRGSTASMKSSGSGASIRPSITETIPEGVDDGPGESAIEEDDYERAQETTEQGRISADKSPEKDRRPHFRRNSRQSHADVGFRSDELLGSTGLNLRSASSSTMQYATSPPPNRLLSAKPSLTFNDRHHSIDAPGKPPPYREYTFSSRDNPLHRNQQVPFQDPPSARPISAKPSYGGDDRDYGPPNSTVHRPHGPRSYFSQRESRPISRQTSFIRQPYIEVDDDDDERDIDRGPDRFWDGEYDRDRDRDGRRSEPRRATTYPYSAPHHSPDGSRLMSQDYVHMNDLYDDRSEGVSGPSHGRYHYRGLPPEDSEYQRPPDGTRPPTRRPSYVIPREDPDRRFSSENDGHSHHYPSAGGIPIPRRTPGLEESPVYPAWRDLSVRPNYEYHQHVRSPPNLESPSHHRFAQCPPSYHNSPHDDHPSFGGREMDSSNRGSVTDEYDSDEDTDEDEDDDGIGVEDRRLRDLEARKQKLEESRRQADDELKRTELKIQQLAEEEARKKRKDKEEQDEADRKAEEARRREEDARKKEEEIRRMEEEVKKKEEDAAKKAEEARKMEEQAKKLEEEAQRKERDARKKEAAAKMKEDEARRKAEDLSRKEEETRQRAVQLEQDTEKTKQMQFEAQKIAEDLKKMEEEAHKKDMEIREREDILRRREEELMRREADNFRREQEARKREEEARKREESRKEEASKEAARKEEARKEEARKEEARKEETRKEEARKEEARKEETRKEEARKEEARKEEARQEEARKEAEARQEEVRLEQVRKEEAKKKEPKQLEARRDKETKKKVAEGKREEEKAKRKLQAEAARRIEEDARREEDILEESQHLDDDIFYDLESKLADPKLMDEQLKLLQEAEFRKREEDIRRIRQERKRNDSVGNDSAWSTSSYPSASPGMSPGMSRTSQFNGPPVSERSAGPSSGWGSSIKPATASPAVNRASANASTGKPRTDSASSGTYPLSSSPHTASFSEAERTRKQQEFAGSQQEQFRRTQEKLEAERQLKSAGRLLSREELQRVFEHHERLWSRLNTLQELSWNDFPWPMVKQPSNPDDMSLSLISAYIQSPVHSDKDKSRTPKDRIKEHIKRWHPDRFETKLLPKVSEGEREKVRHGAGNVARYLSDLLRKENEGSISIFGD